MKQVNIVRNPFNDDGDDGTFGKVFMPNGKVLVSGELPWIDLDDDDKRDRGVSCIRPKPGETKIYRYICDWTKSSSRKNRDGTPEWTYRLRDVPNASGVLIHAGNFVGDVSKDRVADAKGCVLIGMSEADLLIPEKKRLRAGVKRKKQHGITSSRNALKIFIDIMEKKSFELMIGWKFEKNRGGSDHA